jgi:hypothetical protein
MMARLVRTERFTLPKVATPNAAEAAGSIRARATTDREMPKRTRIAPSTVVRVSLLRSVFTIFPPHLLGTTAPRQRQLEKVERQNEFSVQS